MYIYFITLCILKSIQRLYLYLHSHNGSIFGGTPEHVWHVTRRRDTFDPTRMTTEHLRGFCRLEVMNSDLTICRPADHNTVVGAR